MYIYVYFLQIKVRKKFKINKLNLKLIKLVIFLYFDVLLNKKWRGETFGRYNNLILRYS